MDICTFQFATKKNFDKVAWQLLDTPYTFSVCYGEVHYNLPRCITVWGGKAIQNVIDALQDANISYKVVV